MILGLCCVKNSEAWFEQVLRSHLAICDHVLVLDDGSTDRTAEIAENFDRVSCRRQSGLPRNEARDRNRLFEQAHAFRPDWCWWFDGDETVWRVNEALLSRVPREVNTIHSPLLLMWGGQDRYAHDWSIEKRHLFRYLPDVCRTYRWRGSGPHQIHCGACPPTEVYQRSEHVLKTSDIAELHWGWSTPAMIDTKLKHYRTWDPRFGEFEPYRRFEQPPTDVRPLSEWDGTVGRPT